MTEATASLPHEERKPTTERTGKMVLYVGIFSIVMLFAGLSSAYVISSYGELWVNLSMPVAFWLSTAIILLSSLTIRQAVKASNGGDEKKTRLFLGVTVILGLAFGVSQYVGWSQLVSYGSYLSGHVDNLEGTYGEDYTISYQGQELIRENGEYYFPNDDLREKPLTNEIAIYNNSSSSYVYLLSFVHLLHVLGGLLFLIAIYAFAKFKKDQPISNLRLRLGATYWHFVDGLWIYLLLFLIFIH
jgi:cytochrome c oxidase subunit 3